MVTSWFLVLLACPGDIAKVAAEIVRGNEGAEEALLAFQRQVQLAKDLRLEHDKIMLNAPTYGNVSSLQSAVQVLRQTEHDFLAMYTQSSGSLTLATQEYRLYMTVLDLLAATLDDLNMAYAAVHYYNVLLKLDKCTLMRQTNSTKEYEFCSGKYFSRAMLLTRHALGLPTNASLLFHQALAARFLERKVHVWTNEWQIPPLFMPGLRSQPYWEAQDLPALAKTLEYNFAMIQEEFFQILRHPKYSEVFTQNDHALISQGTWGELKLYDGNRWQDVCYDVARMTCRMLNQLEEFMGYFPPGATHNTELPREAAYFKLEPGSKLKPHTGPVNFHLYCHLGLLTPPGSFLRVGSEAPRVWHEGKSLCFDDSFDHEAWNNGTEARYVLMVVLWHPDLGRPEASRAEGFRGSV